MNLPVSLASLRTPLVLSVLSLNALTLTGQTGPLVTLENKKLVYEKFAPHNDTPGGDVIPDFSGVGYRNQGAELLPDLTAAKYDSVRKSFKPTSGDRAEELRTLIKSFTGPGVDGIVGIVEFEPGVYELKTTINITRTGIVLRGKSNKPDDTVIQFTDRGGRPEQGNDCFVFTG
jgi:hypothetical protein